MAWHSVNVKVRAGIDGMGFERQDPRAIFSDRNGCPAGDRTVELGYTESRLKRMKGIVIGW
jgi:hypothetical protein